MVYSSFGSNTPLLTEQILSAIKLLPYIILTAILTVIIGGILYMLYFRKLPHIRQVKLCFVFPHQNISYFKAFTLFCYSVEWFIKWWTISM